MNFSGNQLEEEEKPHSTYASLSSTIYTCSAHRELISEVRSHKTGLDINLCFEYIFRLKPKTHVSLEKLPLINIGGFQTIRLDTKAFH